MATTGGDRGPDRLDVYRVSYVIWSREGGGYQGRTPGGDHDRGARAPLALRCPARARRRPIVRSPLASRIRFDTSSV